METLKIQIPEGFKVESFNETTGEIKFTPKPTDIRDRIKTIDDAIKILGDDDPDVIDYWKIESTGITSHVFWNQKLILIIKALNEGWTPDWHNDKWDKFYPWFYMDGSSSSGRFSFHDSGNRDSCSYCGSRLCFKSKELAQYAAKQFLDIYEKAFTI